MTIWHSIRYGPLAPSAASKSLYGGYEANRDSPFAWTPQVIADNPDLVDSIFYVECRGSYPEAAETFEELILSLIPTEGWRPMRRLRIPSFCSQTALRPANRPKLREFLWTRKPRRFAETAWWAVERRAKVGHLRG
jgi:hypothetical protein